MDNFDLRKYLAEGKLYEAINLDIEDDIAYLSGDSGEYEGEIEDGKTSFSIIYDDLDYRISDQYDENNIEDFLGKGHAFVELAKKYDHKWGIERDLVGITIKLKDLAEGKLNENLQIDDLFGEYVAQWSQGNYDYDFAELKPGPIKGSLVDDFTLGPDEYDDDDDVRDYKMMRDYLLKNKSYELSRDSKEDLSQFPVQFSLEDDGEIIKADIYYSPEYLKAIDNDEM